MWHKKLTQPQRLPKMWRNKSTGIDYQYIKKSIIPTMHFQKSLPRLPIPKLEDTCDRYLAAQHPLLNNEDFKRTEQYVNKFKSSIGKTLQDLLIKHDRANKHTSYISEPWFDMYLRDRKPLPINYNPVLVSQNDQRPDYNNQAIRATNLLISSLRFYKSLKENILEPEVFHMNPVKSDNTSFRKVCALMPAICSWYAAYLHNAYPLDMSQYYNLFNTSRIPEIDKDRILYKKERHILVQYKGHFYVFNVLNEAGNILEPQELLAGIQNILNENVDNAEFPLGVLTTLDRNEWAKIRQNLIDLGNEKSLHLIDSALFNICLDDTVIAENKYEMVRTFLHSDGKNRWFDKSISLLLSKDGFTALNFEHSWGDGVAVLRYFQDILKDSNDNPQVHPNTIASTQTKVERLEFNLNDSVKLAIDNAHKDYVKLCKSLDINFIESNNLGRGFCKKYSISPDAVMQMCFQSAYYKLYNKFVPTYESCSTAAFKHGRTETIRPNTKATKNFCLAINSMQKPSNTELVNLIKQCSKVHIQLTKEAAMGQGFDRHLFALKTFAKQMNLKEAELFNDPAYQEINRNVLSTSTLSSPVIIAGGFGPVIQEGLGVGYVIRDNSMGTLVTSYPGTDGKEFISCLKTSIEEVVATLTAIK